MRGHCAVALIFTCVFAVASSAHAQRDNLLCYKARADRKACAPGAPNAGALCKDDSDCGGGEDACAKLTKFPKDVEVVLDDIGDPNSVGESKTFNVKKAKHVCVPIDDHGNGIADAGRYYLGYQIKQERKICNAGGNQNGSCRDDDDCPSGACVDQPKFDRKVAKNANIFVEDQFANIRLDVNKVDFLLSPAAACADGDDTGCLGTAAPAPGSEDYFKCYKAKATKKVCAPGTPTELQACRKDEDCPGGGADSCVKLDKFTRGQTTYATDAASELVVADPNDPNSPDRTFDLKKISHFCKAAQTTTLPSGSPEGPVDSRARFLCYKMKASRSHCLPAAPINALGACRKEEDCGGNDSTSLCVPQAKFDRKDPDVQGFYVNDSFDVAAGSDPNQPTDYHRLDLNKEAMICVPGCEDPDESLQFTSHVLRLTSLSLPPSGNPGDGLDLDMNPLTCGPESNCSGGVDNSLGLLSVIVPDINSAIASALSAGDIHIILEIDDFADGSQVVNGYEGQLDTGDPGCTDVNSGAQVCNYVVSGVELDTRTCGKTAEINFPVTVSGLPASPAAVDGGGPQSSFTIAIPFLDIELALTARNVQLVSSVTHSGGTVESATGILGGAIIHRQLKQTINSLPPGLCIGGANANEPCAVLADCPDTGVGTACDTGYLGGIPLPVIAGFVDVLPRDIDTDGQLSCEGGINNGEPCTIPAECPDPSTSVPGEQIACESNDATSIGLPFAAIDAAISGAETECTLATCSLE